MSVLATLRNERDHLTLMEIAKKRINLSHPVELEYSSFVTQYALSFISKQLSVHDKVTIIQKCDNFYEVSSSEGSHEITISKQSYIIIMRFLFHHAHNKLVC